MSDPNARRQGIRFEPIPDRSAPVGLAPVRPAGATNPSIWHLYLGVLLPVVVIIVEKGWRLCAQTFFDPMPTAWHTLAIAVVPVTNFLVWRRLSVRHDISPRAARWIAFGNGGAIAIAAFYALIFAPLAPIAVLAIVVYGVGLLPLAPLAALASAARLRHLFNSARGGARPSRRPFLAGLGTGLALLLALDIPAAATRLGVQWAASDDPDRTQRGIFLLRSLGDDDLLLRLCYDTSGRPAGLLSALVMFSGRNLLDQRQQPIGTTAQVREIFYRVHGTPFNARPAPFDGGAWQRFRDLQLDGDHGGNEVGGRIAGLSLASSRIDGSISSDDALAYLEWTVAFRNASPVDREARMQIALPPGGVVSRATLWVDGEEREAAYGGRGEVRAAYQKVAVQQRRDPLLVTTKGGDRVLAQAFPVGRDGGTIKFKLGITAPLTLTALDKGHLTLPAILERNFAIAQDASHSVWIEAKRPLSSDTAGLNAQHVDPGRYRIAGAIGDGDLARRRPSVLVERTDAGPMIAGNDETGHVRQEIATPHSDGPASLMLVVDGSARLKSSLLPLITALDAIPSSARVGVIVASEPNRHIAISTWTEAHKRDVVRALRSTVFTGGQDNAPALALALRALEGEARPHLLWVHGPQPLRFKASEGALEQAAARVTRLPTTTLYTVEPGPNEALPDMAWAWRARLLPASGDTTADLAHYLGRTLGDGPAPIIRRSRVASADGATRGSDHIARLWAHDHVLELVGADAKASRPAALALAVQHRLVTPISGAVVLETQQQYRDSGLSPVEPATVPTVPEPHEWALMFAATVALLWMMRQRQRAQTPTGRGLTA